MSSSRKPFKVGIMCQSCTFSHWAAESIRALAEIPGVEISLLIQEGQRRISPAPPPRGRWRRLYDSIRDGTLKAKIIHRLDWLGSRSLFDRYRAWQQKTARIPAEIGEDLSHLLEGVPALRCDTLAKGRFAEVFKPADVDAINSHGLDCILKFGFNIVHGEVLNAARYGVWSYHHDDHLKYRGGPPGFWEVFHGDPWTGSMLQRINEKLDDGAVLHKEFIRTSLESYSDNIHRAWRASATWPALVSLLIQSGQPFPPQEENIKSTAPIYRVPRNREAVRFFAQQLQRKIFSRLRRRGPRQEHWAIGVTPRTAGEFLKSGPGPVHWICAPQGKFCADPFVVTQGSEHFLFYEQLDHATGEGEIRVAQTSDWRQFSPSQRVLGEPGTHLSYPMVFQDQGQWLCVPEASRQGSVSLYEATEFPARWRQRNVILNDFAGIDPTIFFHEDRWWMLVGGPEAEFDSLHAYYAQSLNGPWKAHSLNPIVTTRARRSRPAGRVFQQDGRLFRPAQYGHRYYGYGLLLYTIDVLNPQEYRESLVRVQIPQVDWPFPDGMHHVDFTPTHSIFDAKVHFHGKIPVNPPNSSVLA